MLYAWKVNSDNLYKIVAAAPGFALRSTNTSCPSTEYSVGEGDTGGWLPVPSHSTMTARYTPDAQSAGTSKGNPVQPKSAFAAGDPAGAGPVNHGELPVNVTATPCRKKSKRNNGASLATC